jgi:hypothetical protein
MTKAGAEAFTENIFLRSDNGAELNFRGRLYSEYSYYDEERATNTRLRLFITDQSEHVYSIMSDSGAEKQRRHYTVAPDGDQYRISNGVQTLTLPLETLFAAVFGLCGIDPDRAEELKSGFEETLRMIVGE